MKPSPARQRTALPDQRLAPVDVPPDGDRATLLDRMDAAYRTPLRGIRKAVLVALVRHTDDAGACWPSVDRLAAMVGASDRAVRDHLAALEADGWLVRDRTRRPWDGRYAGYRYVVSLPRLGLAGGAKPAGRPPAKPAGGPPAESAGPEGVTCLKGSTAEVLTPPTPPIELPEPSPETATAGRGVVDDDPSRSAPRPVRRPHGRARAATTGDPTAVAYADRLRPHLDRLDVDPADPTTAAALVRLAEAEADPRLVAAEAERDLPDRVWSPRAFARTRLGAVADDPPRPGSTSGQRRAPGEDLAVRYAQGAAALRAAESWTLADDDLAAEWARYREPAALPATIDPAALDDHDQEPTR